VSRNLNNQTPKQPRWITALLIIVAVVAAEYIAVRGFRQQHSRFLVQKSTAMLSRPDYVAPGQQVAARAVELNPYDGYAWFNLGTSVYLQSQFPQAVAIFKQGIDYLPHSYNAIRLLAFSHYSMKDFAQAAQEFSEYLAMMPSPPVSPELVFTRSGLAALRVGQLADATYDLQRATPLEQDKTENLRARIMAAVLGNRLGGALYCTRLFRFYSPQQELNPFEMVANALRGQKLPLATTYLESILPESSKDQSVLKALAAAYSSGGQPQKAEALIAAAVQAEPQSPSLRLVYGDILYAQKRYPEAIAQYDEHLKLQPNSPLRADIQQKKKAAEAAP
jgi:Tfp pilus assembly protein PilF